MLFKIIFQSGFIEQALGHEFINETSETMPEWERVPKPT